MKHRTLKKIGGLIVLIQLLSTAGHTVPVQGAVVNPVGSFGEAVEQALRSGDTGACIYSQPFTDKKDIYRLMEQTVREVDSPEIFLSTQCYATYRMVTLSDGAGFCLTAEIGYYEKVNDLHPEEIVEELDLSGCTDLQIAIRVHDWLTGELAYGASEDTLRECLEYGYGKCDDYSMIYAAVMNAAGVETRCMDGVPDGTASGHMWNMVLMDGAWYLCDVTNDDLENSYDYFMKALNGSDVRTYLGSYLDGYRLCNGVDEFLSYPLAKNNYFRWQGMSSAKTVNLASKLSISVSRASSATVEAVADAGETVKRVTGATHKIKRSPGVRAVYGTYKKGKKTYHYLICFK